MRAIASDGSSVYWAASTKSNDPFSDIVGVPLGGGEPQTIGCHLYGVELLLADESALYCETRHGDQIVRLPKPNAP